MFGRLWHRRSSHRLQARPPRAVGLLAECLEDRCVASVTTNFHDGLLKVTGDAGANAVTLTEQGAPGAYRVGGVDVGQQTDFTGVQSVLINLRGGSDSVAVNGSAAAGTRLKGGLYAFAKGDLSVTVNDNVNIAGRLTIDHVGGRLGVTVQGAWTTLGSFLVMDADGPSNVSLTGSATVLGEAVFDLGGGTNLALVHHAAVGGLLSQAGRGGDDTLDVEGSAVGGRVAADFGAGANQLRVTGTTVAGSVAHRGAGAESVFLTGSTAEAVRINAAQASAVRAELYAFTTSGRVAVTGGKGSESVDIGGSVIGSLFARLKGGSNDLAVRNSQLAGAFDYSGAGTETVVLQDSAVARGLRVRAAEAAGAVQVSLLNTMACGAVTVDTGGGNDSVNFFASSVNGRTALSLGAGSDTVTTGGAVFAKAFAVRAGDGDNTLNVERTTDDDSSDTTFAGTFSYQGGADGDTLYLGRDAANVAYFLGASVFEGGGGSDRLYLAYAQATGGVPAVSGFTVVP
jgi:hypothetical protein